MVDLLVLTPPEFPPGRIIEACIPQIGNEMFAQRLADIGCFYIHRHILPLQTFPSICSKRIARNLCATTRHHPIREART